MAPNRAVRLWTGTLLALGPDGLRYEFTGTPSDSSSWFDVDVASLGRGR